MCVFFFQGEFAISVRLHWFCFVEGQKNDQRRRVIYFIFSKSNSNSKSPRIFCGPELNGRTMKGSRDDLLVGVFVISVHVLSVSWKNERELKWVFFELCEARTPCGPELNGRASHGDCYADCCNTLWYSSSNGPVFIVAGGARPANNASALQRHYRGLMPFVPNRFRRR